jgi:hypothetical protein
MTVDIAPDVWCKTCGWVILCPHTPCVPYPPGCITPRPPQVEYERTGNFLEDLARCRAAGGHPITDDIAAAAEEYARNGWRVHPLRGKVPVLDAWNKAATTDVCQVINWWTGAYRNHNIGIALPDHLWALDVDGPPKLGREGLARLQSDYEQLPETLSQTTGSGGCHLIFRRPPSELTSTRINKLYSLEIRVGGKNQIVAAPSVHPDTGKRYVWHDAPIAATPPWLAALVVKQPPPRRRPVARDRFTSVNSPSPADTYNATASWADVLEPHGWRCLDADPDAHGARWLHPKATSQMSAHVRHVGDGVPVLKVFTTSTIFETDGKAYTRFGAYALLNHGGDMSAAAKHLLTQQKAA